MKKISVLSLAATLLLLMSCHPATEVKTSPDLLTFGVKGDVMMVLHSIELLETSDEELGDSSWLAEDDLELSFDPDGRVICDVHGNSYEYDENGEFIEGLSANTVMTRDSQGRIVYYDNTDVDIDDEDFDITDYVKLSYTYDDKGRVATEEYRCWEWMTEYTYSYEGDNIYPSSCTFESNDEGWYSEGTITYEYFEFDKKGNWTERLVSRNAKNYDEPWGDEEPEVEDYFMKTRETREFFYWEDHD